VSIRVEPLAVSVPDVRAFRWSTDQLYTGLKETLAIGRVESGRSSFWSRGQVRHAGPGSLMLRRPGEVHRDVARDGASTVQVVSFPDRVVADAGRLRMPADLPAGDARGAVFQRLHDAVRDGAGRLALAVAVAEALDALSSGGEEAPGEPSRPVRRAVELLRERLDDAISLDELAAHAGLDRFRLCRAFRAQVGLPPHAYLTRLRIERARQLLAAGVRPGEVARRVGLYDQSQLNRHFRRIVGTTPGRYARAPG
jgi:AraC-like DNA-binding protein